jgi:hypothetical protein
MRSLCSTSGDLHTFHPTPAYTRPYLSVKECGCHTTRVQCCNGNDLPVYSEYGAGMFCLLVGLILPPS